MTYKEAITYVNSFINFERTPDSGYSTTEADIERFRILLEYLGNPHQTFPIVHVAGTKGKGSVSAILTAVLKAAGYRVGLYTSPHLVTIRERIRIGNNIITKANFAQNIKRISKTPESIKFGGRIAFRTVFEHLTAAAFLEFAKRKVDIAIVETGLGGRLDATIVVDPILSVLTPIGLDHTAILGETCEQIAWEKAHIIKEKIPVVSAKQKPAAFDVFRQFASEKNTKIFLSKDFDYFNEVQLSNSRTEFKLNQNMSGIEFKFNLPGRFQLENLGVAFTAVECLRNAGFQIMNDDIRLGISKVRWDGRLKIYRGKPPVILDGGHNALGVEIVSRSLKEMFPHFKWRVVFAANKGKPIAEMVSALRAETVKFYFAPLQFPKTAPIDFYCNIIDENGYHAEIFENAPGAFESAIGECSDSELVFVVGSLYLVGEVLRFKWNLPPPPADGSIDDRI